MCGIIIFYSSFRPTAEEVLRHCLFWIEKKQLEFFKEVHFYTKQKHHDAYKAIEEGASILFKDSWKNYITSCHLTNKKECRISVYLVYGQYLMSIFK